MAVHSLAAYQEYLMQQQLEDVFPETHNFASLTPATPALSEMSFTQHPALPPTHPRRALI
jgi:hypothetical protein